MTKNEKIICPKEIGADEREVRIEQLFKEAAERLKNVQPIAGTGRDKLTKIQLSQHTEEMLNKFEAEDRVSDCFLTEIVDEVSKRMHSKVCRNCKIAHFPNLTLTELARMFKIELKLE